MIHSKGPRNTLSSHLCHDLADHQFAPPPSMSAHHDLLAIYHEWRDWTLREGEAIRCGDWNRVHSCQNAKLELQDRIIRSTQTARTELARSGGDWAEIEAQVRREVSSLIDLEHQNGEVLAQKRSEALAEQAELDRSSRQLRQLRSYAPVVRSAWSSYS